MSAKFICDGCGKETTASARQLQPSPPVAWSRHLTRRGFLDACSVACAAKIAERVRAEDQARKAEQELVERG